MLKGVNISHVQINEHGAIFNEVIELLVEAVRESGLPMKVSRNEFFKGSLNVVVGHVAFKQSAEMETVRKAGIPYVVVQLEALDAEAGFLKQYPSYVDVLRGAMQIWDYSEGNVAFLKWMGLENVRYIPIGFGKNLERIVAKESRDIDVMFYGMVNTRRRKVLEGLVARGVRVEFFVGYGAKRDELIGRSKIMLNMHQFELGRLEQVRISYLLNNRCFVVSETADENPYGEGGVYSGYEGLVETCVKYLRPEMEGERARIAEAGYEALKGFPMKERVREALMEIEGLEWRRETTA